ncbi:MAG: GntR family transcriptional regulator [Actinomycetota bacterium]
MTQTAMTQTAMTQTAQIYDRLRAAILALELAPGERLTERGLEAAFAASRTPVRAALLRLDSEGLVQRGERGFAVAPIDTVEIGQLAELREAVEVAAIRLAVGRASADDIAALGALLDESRGSTDAVPAGDAFHEQLARLSGNGLLADSVRGAMTRLARTRWLEARTVESRESAWREHRAIVDAVEARDADRAARLVAEHIRGTNQRLLASLGEGARHIRVTGPEIKSWSER